MSRPDRRSKPLGAARLTGARSREGRAPIEGEWAEGVTGLRGMRCEIAMLATPDGHGRVELSRFERPPLRVMFTVEDLDETLARLYRVGATLVDRVVQYEDAYRLCYLRGPQGILIGLAEELARYERRV